MITLPLTLAMIALSQNQASSTSSADLNNDGTVNTADLILLMSNLGTACEGDCPTDLNNDGVTDQNDVLAVMQSWGAVPGWTDPNAEAESSEETEGAPQDLSWKSNGPVLLDAIYYDQLSSDEQRSSHGEALHQGEKSRTWGASNNLNMQPIKYYGGVDANTDGQYTNLEKELFAAWVEENIPADYTGPICLDMEGQWWSMWNTGSQEVMDVVIDYYIEGLQYAQSLRPNAKIGYWGLPKKSHTSATSQTASVQRLVEASTALFPDVYEWAPGIDDSVWLERHVRNTIALSKGQVPIYVQASPRYRDSETQKMVLHTQEEFIHDQVNSALNAVWTDENGNEHRICGVSMWDAYSFVASQTQGWSLLDNKSRKALWDDLDSFHLNLLVRTKSCVDAACQEFKEQTTNASTAANTEALAEAARVAAAQEEASRLRAERKRQRSRLIRRVNSERTIIRRASSNYRKNAKQYRTARSSFKNKRRSFVGSRNVYRAALKQWRASGRKQARGSKSRSSAWKKFATARNQYRSSRSSWRTNVTSWRASAKNFKQERSSYRTSRNAWRSTVKTWRAANATWRQMAATATTLAAIR